MNKFGQAFVERIRQAFSAEQEPYEGDVFIEAYYFDDERVYESSKAFIGKRWHELPLEIVVRTKDNMYLMTSEAFFHFFPAFLIAVIEETNEADTLIDTLLFCMNPEQLEDTPERKQSLTKAISMFNLEQLQTIVSYFEEFTKIFPTDRYIFSPDDDVKIKGCIAFLRKIMSQKV